MRFYEKPDVNFYVDASPGWEQYCHYPMDKEWRVRPPQNTHYINSYRDVEGAYMPHITDEDLYFQDWPKTRRNKNACLPLQYNGARFIKLEKGPPAGFTCTPTSMNLAEAQIMFEILNPGYEPPFLPQPPPKKRRKGKRRRKRGI